MSVLGKMTVGFTSIVVVNSEKNDNVNFFRYMCFNGKNENLAETPILKDFFIFVAMVSLFKNVSSKWRC